MKKRWTLGDTFLLLTGAAILLLGWSAAFRERPAWNESFFPYPISKIPIIKTSNELEKSRNEKDLTVRTLHRAGWGRCVRDFLMDFELESGLSLPKRAFNIDSTLDGVTSLPLSEWGEQELLQLEPGFAFHVGYLQAELRLKKMLEEYSEQEVRSRLESSSNEGLEFLAFLGLAAMFLVYLTVRITANLDWEPNSD